MATDLPYFPLFPSDWVLETKFLTLHEQGALLQLVCAMHESQVRGYLLFNDGPMPPDRIARILGIDRQPALDVLDRLLESHVLKKDADSGVVFYPPMVKREKLRKTRQESGKKGGLKSKPPNFALAKTEQQPQQTLEYGTGNGSYPVPEGGGEGGREDFEVEPPPGFPRSVSEAVSKASNIVFQTVDKPARVITEIFVSDAWKEAKSRGWRDRQGNPIGEFRSYLDVAWSRRCQWEDRNPVNGDRPKTPNDIRMIIEAKKTLANGIRNQYASECAAGTEWSDNSKRQEYFKLKKEIKQLTTQIASML